MVHLFYLKSINFFLAFHKCSNKYNITIQIPITHFVLKMVDQQIFFLPAINFSLKRDRRRDECVIVYSFICKKTFLCITSSYCYFFVRLYTPFANCALLLFTYTNKYKFVSFFPSTSSYYFLYGVYVCTSM